MIDKGGNNNSNKDSVLDLFNRLVRGALAQEEFYSRVAKVLSVDEQNALATVEVIGGAIITDVRLQQTPSNGLLMLPTIGSIVIISWTDNTTAYIAMYSAIDSISMRGGALGGIIKIEELTAKINEVVQTLNDTITDVNTLKQVFAGWVSAPGDGGAALKAAAASWYAQQIAAASALNKDDYENTTITHG